ncbi:MAG: anti-sigma factor antagonist [Oscillospiraceae bacterium]|nr:anti-sigma factor antagonist [Oscillospiraceae bacterium]
MSVIINNENNTLTAKLQGEIDHHNVQEIRQSIDLAADKSHPEILILDFGEVTFMDSSGIGLVMGRYKLVKDYGGRISVTNTSSHIKKVMKLAGLERLVSIE